MTTPEQIIAKIEEIEKMLVDYGDIRSTVAWADLHLSVLELKQRVIFYFNLTTADPPEGSPGQSDIEG